MKHESSIDYDPLCRSLRRRLVGCVFATWITACAGACAEQVVDEWRYTLKHPNQGWEQTGFDDSAWRKGSGGFGTHQTPGARVGALWSTNDIWLRKSFSLAKIPDKAGLLIHHDEDVEVFINGKPVVARKGYTTDYVVIPIGEEKRQALRVGKNVMAVHCHQTQGGQFIDVHLVSTSNPPQLPRAKPPTTPFKSDLITKWGAAVTPDNAWTEYPRPQLRRKQWQNLNGLWEYAVTPESQRKPPTDWNGKILVPYCLESRLGGVQRLLDASEALWYRRSFDAKSVEGERTLLNFEAVDYECEVFVNGQSVGTHRGGNTPFSFDATSAVRNGANELIVRVEDDTEAWQLRGKQVLNPRGIWYTRVSGIWQTVWLERVPTTHIKDLKISTNATEGTITITVRPALVGGLGVTVEVKENGETIVGESSSNSEVVLKVPNAKLWSPDSPHLYEIEVSLFDGGSIMPDRVQSYVGIRSVGRVKDADGHWRFTLNGEPIFHWGPLDQGWWPDGLLTPPSDEAMRFDIEFLKAAGFNMIRKHIKVEPRRYYYHCDQLGIMLWQDHVSGGKSPQTWSRLKPGPRDAEWPDDRHEQFMLELEQMVDNLENHPSIVVWVPFNEHWGQHRTMEIGKWIVNRDPSRLVNIASGGNFWPVGHVVDAHNYPHPQFPFSLGTGGRFDDYIKVMGEFGGHGYPVKGHLWDADRRNWGYGGLPKNKGEYRKRYLTSLDKLDMLRRQGISAGVYTQTTDVEGEINGLMTYDRKVIKIPASELSKLHARLFTSIEENDASRSSPSTFVEQETDHKPGDLIDAETIRTGLKSHDRAFYIKPR